MKTKYYFSFGQELTKVEQKDKTQKKAFVHTGAVYAKWGDKDGISKVFAVASEPDIFWTGENAEEIISKINIPIELDKQLVPKTNTLMNYQGEHITPNFSILY